MRTALTIVAICLHFAPAAVANELRVGYDHGAGRTSYRSPDRSLRAVVAYLPPRGYGEAESVVKILTAAGRLLALGDYSESGGGNGETVVRGRWTPDSRFFVFSTESSGGHSPWHYPTHIYSRRRGWFFCLDGFVGPITTPQFGLSPPARLRTQTLAGGPTTVDLRRVEWKLSAASEEKDFGR